MAAPIGPGDWVECIVGGDHRRGAFVELGAVNVVSQIGTFQGVECLQLRGVSSVYRLGEPAWFDVKAFRPIYRPDEKLIASLLEKQPADEPVAA